MPTVQKWGNSLAVRIPAALAGQLEMSEGSPVVMSVQDDALVLRPKSRRKYSLEQLLKRCGPKRLHQETDFGPDVGREVIR